MPFIPHTKTETETMLAAVGATKINDLFKEIPNALRAGFDLKDGLSELEISQLMQARAAEDGTPVCFAGAGAYDHHIPSAVWQIATRGEFYSAYTPYQAEASQGTLQLLYEFQTMVANLMAMDVSNTSLYDGASGLAEAILMAVRANKKSKSKQVLMPKTVNPAYRRTVHAIVKNQGITLTELDFTADGVIDPQSLDAFSEQDFAAMVVPFPNYFGRLEDIDALTNWAHENNILLIASVNPMAISWLKPPGIWGDGDNVGADIACGEGQPLGIPLSSGGPYFGFLTCKQSLVRQMPGRLIGKTTDTEGRDGFALTLQAREQHIRRSKATSNICTNQGLMVTAATIYMAIMGERGLRHTAIKSHENNQKLLDKLTKIDGVNLVFKGDMFNESVLSLEADVDEVIRALAMNNIVAGVSLKSDYPAFGNALLVCATEKHTDAQMIDFADKLARVMHRQNPVKCTITPNNF